VPEQRELFDYWRMKAAIRPFPSRQDINPAELKHLLPSISLLDIVSEESTRLRVRLAGTRLRDYLGVEITGHFLDEFDLGNQKDYWDMAYQEVIEHKRPAQGVISLAPWKQPGIFQFWLRLPLADDEGCINMVLGHDAFLHSEKAQVLMGRTNLRIA